MRKTLILKPCVLLITVLALSSKWVTAATDIDISSYDNFNWYWSGAVNGDSIITALGGGNQNTGITFGDWDGNAVAVGPGPEQIPGPLTLDITPVMLPTSATVNALFNTLYGQAGTVNGTIVFKNSNGATASYSLIGDQTIRDYNQMIYTNTVDGPPPVDGVMSENWWNNYSSGGWQRLDVATFILPSSWAGTELDSVTIINPYSGLGSDFEDLILSALQISSVPEPGSEWLLGVGVAGLYFGSRFSRRLVRAKATAGA